MDFENMKRKQLQALCKEHGIPANLTNLEMANKLSSLLKVNDEKPLTRGRSCLKMLDENESDAVNRKVKKVKFSPDNEVIEFTRSAQVKRGGRRNTMLYKNNLNVRSDGLKVGILDSPVRVTRSQGVNIEDGVTEKKGRTRQVKDSVISVNKSKDEVGVTTKRTLKNKEVGTILEKREENEGANDGVRMSRRVRSRKNAKESVEDSQEEPKMDESEKAIGREEKRDKKVTFISGGHMDECTKSETKAKEPKRVTRRKSMTHNQTLPVQSEVDAEVREEVVEKPARVTRSRNLKPVEDNLSNKRNRTRGRKAIETSEEQLCTEFVESSVEAVKDEARVITRGSRQNSVVEAPEKALKRSGRIANKDKGSRLSDDITKEKMVTGGRTRNQSSSTVQASTSESGTKIVESKGKHEVVLQLEEPVEVPPRRSDRRKSVLPLEKLRGDEVAAKKEKRNFLTVNDDELRQKVTEEPQKALKRSKRLATQVEDSVLAKDDIAENKIGRPTESQGTLEVVLQTGEVPVRSNRRKSVVPSLEKLRSDEVVVLKEKKTLNANDGEIGSKRTKEEPQKISKRSKRLAKQMEDPVLAKHDIAENKLEERRLSRRNVANANVDTKILDRSVQEETSVVKEERRRSGRSASRHTLAAVSDDKKEKGENQLTKRNCAVQDKDSTNKFTLQDLDSAKQSISSSKASVKASVVKKTSTAGKKQQGRLKRSNVEVEVLMPEDMEIVREPDNKDCNISGSGGTMSFSRSSLNELDAVPDDVNIVLAGTKDDTTAESSILADKLTEEGPLVDANSSLSENKSASKSLPFSDPFISDARPEENLLKELLQSDHEEQPASKGLCPGSVLADDAVPNDLTFDKQEPGATVVDNVEEFVTGLSNDVFDNCSLSQSNNMEEILDSGTKDDAAAESSPLADRLIEEGPLVDANASPSENNSISEPFSDSFNSNATPKQNLVEELLQCDHEAPAGKDLCPSPILADDAVPNEITSDKQEHGSIAAHNVEGLSDEILDNCSPSQSENMEENLDSGFKEQSETGCVVTEGVSHDEHEPASKVICPGSALADDAVPNDIISDKQEHGTVEADNAGLKEQSETGCIVMEGVTYGEQEPGSKGLCPSSVFADDAVPNDITSDKLEHGSIAADTAEEFDSGSSKEVLDSCSVNQSVNMEDKLDSGFKESSATRCIVSVGVNYGEQELTAMDYAKELDAGLSSNVLLDNLGAFNHSNEMECKISEAEAESGPVEQSDAESDLVEANYDLDAPTFTSQDEIHAEECGNLEVAAPEKTISSPIKTVLDLQVAERGILGDGITLHVTPLEDCDEEKQGEELKILFATPGYVSHSKEKKAFLAGDSRDEDLNREGQVSPISGNDTSNLLSSLRDCGEHGQGEYLKRLFATPFGGKSSKVDIATSSVINETSSQCQHSFHENENITLHVTPSEDCDEVKQGEELKKLFATPGYVSHSKEEKKASLDGDSREEGLNREGQVSPISGNDTSSLQNSVCDYGEHGQGEYLKRLFATPFGGKSSKADIATSIAINETSSQYQHSFHENENVGEDLKGLFATPSVVSQSVGDLHYFFENQLSGEAMTTRGLGSSGKVNLSESVRGLFENKQVEQVRTSFASPVSVKCSHQETTSTKGNCSLSHEMEPYICSGVERDLSESVSEQQMVPEINQSSPNRIASPISEPTCDDIGFSEQQMLPEINKSSLGNIKTSDAFDDSTEDHLRLLFATPIKEVSPSRLGEASSCQLKTAMIAWASEMAGKQPKQGLEFAGEPLTVEIISGGSDRTKSSHFSKEIEQFKGGPLFPTPSKGTRPLQFEESPGCEEDIFKYLDGVKLLNNREQNFEQHSDCQFSNAITDDTSEETLHWIQTNDDNVPIQTELETQKEIGSARPFEPLHEEGEVTEDDPLAEGKEDNHPVPYQESIEDEVINTDEAAKSGALSDAICQKPNILLTDIKTENVTQESTSKTDGFSVSAESGILEFDAESTALRSQEPIIITVEETKGDEVQKLEVSNISNTFLDNILNDDEYAKNNSTVLPADEQFQFPEHYAIENDGSSTEGFTAFTNECQHVSKEDDLAAEGDRLVIFESNESTSMNVNDSGLTTQMDMPGIFAEEPQCGSDKEKPSAAKQQDDSFDKKEHESTEAVLSPSKSHESISFSEEGIAGEDKLIFEKKDELAEKKVALTPATGVAKTSFAKHLNSTVKKKNARSILIHGTPNKLTQIADMKENAPNVKGDIGTLTALRPDKRPALKDLPRK
ncbi:uncharacterized protein LOC107017675 isoform X4 [Solanum pennellii]|uniref:Uncharacterized protein LOC107017675 isoform X4 n=1 Tax=Solanum pennellii TaxID=28526 RepID=A0ABM1GMR1_SOLPN|nr:uncharacterized protein LOC107017675 isoform X4 [Solanum pennellii]